MINFSIPKALLSALDRQAKSEVKTRSEALRDAVRLYIRQQRGLEEIFSFGQDQAERLGVREDQVEGIVDEYRQGK